MSAGGVYLLVATATLLAMTACSPPPKIHVEDDVFGDLERVRIWHAEGTAPGAAGIVLLLGTEADWRHGAGALARQLAAGGWLVAGIHSDRFVAARRRQQVGCLELATLLDVFSQHLQQRFRLASYQRPLLLGYRDGGSLAYLALAQADAGLFRGAVSLGFAPRIRLPLPFCAHDGTASRALADGTVQILPVARAAPRWSLWQTPLDAEAKALVDAIGTAGLHAESIHPDDAIGAWLPRALADLDAHGAGDLADLPLVEMPAGGSVADYVAIILSGDGGWANIDRDIGNTLNARGVDVVGWNSLQYFWTRRTPEGAAADLARVLRHYATRWGKPRALLIGYSLGADVLPFMVNRLAPAERERIAGIALLSASSHVDFEFHVSDWLDADPRPALATGPELARLGSLPVQCYYGRDDADSACRGIQAPAGWDIAELAGDHHFNGAYEALTDRILANMPASDQAPAQAGPGDRTDPRPPP